MFEEDELIEDIESSMPIRPLPHDEVYEFIKEVKPGQFFNVGYIKEETSKLASKYRGGRGSEGEPQIRVFKVTEMYGCTGVDYENKEATQAYRAETGKERVGNVYHVEADIANKILKLGQSGNEALQFYPKTGAVRRTRWYISFDGGDLMPTNKQELAQYMPPAFSAERPQPTSSGATVNRLLLSGIYWIGNLGHSILR